MAMTLWVPSILQRRLRRAGMRRIDPDNGELLRGRSEPGLGTAQQSTRLKLSGGVSARRIRRFVTNDAHTDAPFADIARSDLRLLERRHGAADQPGCGRECDLARRTERRTQCRPPQGSDPPGSAEVFPRC